MTKRQKIARANRAKRKGITPEGRERLRQVALERQPWRHSTGPRTAEGKSASRRNAWKHGERAWAMLPDEVRAAYTLLRETPGMIPQELAHDAVMALASYPGIGMTIRAVRLLSRHQRRMFATWAVDGGPRSVGHSE